MNDFRCRKALTANWRVFSCISADGIDSVYTRASRFCREKSFESKVRLTGNLRMLKMMGAFEVRCPNFYLDSGNQGVD